MISCSDLIGGILTSVTWSAFASCTTGVSSKPDQDKYHASPGEPSLWDVPRADRNGVLACDAPT
jgi:hypothetical protein